MSKTAYLGAIFHCLGAGERDFEHHAEGALLVDENGRIVACGEAQTLARRPDFAEFSPVRLAPGQLLMPGLIDCHVHLPQFYATGRQEASLLDWLNRHIFAEEARFADAAYARQVSDAFFNALLANGTTTACVFLTSHLEASRAAFESALATGNRVVMGMNLMDVNAPDALIAPANAQLAESEALCRQWHGQAEGRLQYAWMPRFALTSSEALLTGIGRLREQYPDVYLHTHLSEQAGEIAAVKAQFPWAQDYTAVYERFGLLGPKSILAHSIHLSDGEMRRLHDHQCLLAHCPGSNFFLKSGRFPWARLMEKNLMIGLGSDVGAGPTLSILAAMREAQYMQPEHLIAVNTLFYTATLGAARGLQLADTLGNFLPGKQADFIIVDLAAHPAFSPDLARQDVLSQLASLIYLGDDRAVHTSVVAGRTVYRQAAARPIDHLANAGK